MARDVCSLKFKSIIFVTCYPYRKELIFRLFVLHITDRMNLGEMRSNKLILDLIEVDCEFVMYTDKWVQRAIVSNICTGILILFIMKWK